MKIKGETTICSAEGANLTQVNLSGKSTFIGRNSGESSMSRQRGNFHRKGNSQAKGTEQMMIESLFALSFSFFEQISSFGGR